MARYVFALAAMALVALAAGAMAQEPGVKQEPEFTYLYSTDLSKKQFVDVMRSVDTTAWDNGFKSKGMHKCARYCRRDGGGGVCAAWTFCWGERRCHLLSRLPASLEAAQPGTLSSLMGGNTYNAQCSSGYSKAAANSARLAAACDAKVQPNTLITEVMSWSSDRTREIDAKYDAFQKSSADCCALCAANRSNGCVMWTYQPGGWMVDRNHKCTLFQGANPTVSQAKGITSGVMN